MMISITFLIIILSSIALFIDYRQKKDKKRAAKAGVVISAFLILLNAIPPLYTNFFQEEKYTTKEETKQIKADIENIKSILFEPTQIEVESEIDKQFNHEYGKKRERAFEEYQKGVSAYENNNFTVAIGHFGTAIKIFAIPSFYIYRGNSYVLTSQFDQSISDYSKAIQLNPNNAAAYNNRGAAWGNKGDQDKALADFNKAIQLNPNYAAAYNNRGAVWGRKGDQDKALADFNKAIQLNPNNAYFYQNRSFAYLLRGNIKFGCHDMQKACKLGNCQKLEAAKNKGYCR